MKIRNIFNVLVVSALALMTFACTEKAPEYEPGTPDVKGCYNVYFPQQQSDFVFSKSATKEIVATVARKVTSGAITVPVTVLDETNTVTASDISFGDGQGESTCTLSFSGAVIDQPYKFTVAIEDPKYASKYNANMAINFSFVVENYNFLGKVDFLDLLCYGISLDARELLQIQKVDLYQKDGTNEFRIVDPYANRAAIEHPDCWGAGSTSDNRSPKWEFMMLEDGHLKYITSPVVTGVLYQNEFPIVYLMPSKLGQKGDNKILYHPGANVFMLEPFGYVPDLGGGFGQQNVWVGADPSVDVAALLGL